ncbi:hypothetical protein AAIB41_00870 [Brucella sp. BE17]|uniref:hypothetical protein n=1 Tax=Brucella sp. BE17 TaxID=3142977 RepID=UPI0031BB540E
MTSASISFDKRVTPAGRRLLAQCLFLMLVIALGLNIPLAGLNSEFVVEQAQSERSGMHRLSIFALAASPLLSVLLLLELAKLIFPRLETWRISNERNALGLHVLVMLLVTGVAAMSGYGLVYSFQVANITNISDGYAIAGIASYVGATIAMIWFAGRIRLVEITGALWLLLAIFYLPDFGRELLVLIEYSRMGAISSWQGLLYCALLLAGILVLVAINRTIELSARNDVTEKSFLLSALLWPPFLAAFIASYLVAVPYVFLAELLSIYAPSFIFFIFEIIQAVLIPLILLAYYRFIRIYRPDIACQDHVRPLLLCIAGIQLALGLGLALAKIFVGFPVALSGNILIVSITVLYLIGTVLRPGKPMNA